MDLGALYAALARADYVLVIPAALCTLMGYVLRTARWRLILAEGPGVGSPPYSGS